MRRVTIVIPSYNSAGWVRTAIDSALKQTYSNVDVLVIDDGSTDNTKDVVAEYGDKIRYHFQENQGLAGARNSGVRLAQGECVTFLDADDQYLPEMVQTLVDALEQYPDAGAASAAFIRHGQDGERRYPTKGGILPGGAEVGIVPDFFLAYSKEYFVWGGTIMIRCEVYKAVGESRLDLRTAQDVEMWSRIAGRYPKWVFVDKEVAIYNFFPATSRTLSPKTIPHARYLYPEEQMRQLVTQEQWPSYRIFRRQWAMKTAKVLLRRGERARAKEALAVIAPAPMTLPWIGCWILCHLPTPLMTAMTRFLMFCKKTLRL